MSIPQDILAFISQLKQNNNREWFQANKEWYNRVRADFEQLVSSLIFEISGFDEEIKHVETKDCLFRIYRDVRFSLDKSPYKTHFGAYIASSGGRKSPRGGYYLHLEPEASFVSVGVWCPEPQVLKALRQSVYDNIEELNEIRQEPDFARYYNHFYEEGKLKNVPRDFPKDFPEADLLKLKHYLTECRLTDEMLASDNFVGDIAGLFKAGYGLNRFLNYTVDEVSGYHE